MKFRLYRTQTMFSWKIVYSVMQPVWHNKTEFGWRPSSHFIVHCYNFVNIPTHKLKRYLVHQLERKIKHIPNDASKFIFYLKHFVYCMFASYIISIFFIYLTWSFVKIISRYFEFKPSYRLGEVKGAKRDNLLNFCYIANLGIIID